MRISDWSSDVCSSDLRGRYDLPADYPMVAQGYSAARREVALKLCLGGKRKSSPAPVAEDAPAPPVAEAPEPVVADAAPAKPAPARRTRAKTVEDRKSTRLNSSH